MKAGLDESAISRFMRGTQPSPQSALKLARYFRIPETEMLILTGHIVRAIDTTPSTEIEWMLLEKFRELTEEQQRYAIAQLDLLLEHEAELRMITEHKS